MPLHFASLHHMTLVKIFIFPRLCCCRYTDPSLAVIVYWLGHCLVAAITQVRILVTGIVEVARVGFLIVSVSIIRC